MINRLMNCFTENELTKPDCTFLTIDVQETRWNVVIRSALSVGSWSTSYKNAHWNIYLKILRFQEQNCICCNFEYWWSRFMHSFRVLPVFYWQVPQVNGQASLYSPTWQPSTSFRSGQAESSDSLWQSSTIDRIFVIFERLSMFFFGNTGGNSISINSI